MTRLRVVLDTNVLLSGLAYPNGAPGRIVAAWRSGSLEVVLSHFILSEVARVLPKLNHRLGWTEQDFADFVDLLSVLTEIVEPVPHSHQLRDAADVLVLGTFLGARADYLVTGDRDLLALSDAFPIVTPAELWLQLGS
jgi:putative PIN family toxin of toxin-antitoxin system